MDAAAKVFFERGYADASVQDIADELGILKGSLYHYIDSKEDLLFRIMSETHAENQAILEESQALEGVTALERLRIYVSRQVAYTTRNPMRLAIYYHDMEQLSPDRLKKLTADRAKHARFVSGLITQAQADGDVDTEINPQLQTHFIFGSIIWVYRWYKPSGKVKPDTVVESLTEFVIRGLNA